MGDRGKGGGGSGSLGNCGVSRRRTIKEYKDRDRLKCPDEGEAGLVPLKQPRHLCMESRRYARHSSQSDPTPLECGSREETRPVETMGILPQTKQGHHGRGEQVVICRFH